jgi:hypothetical protein
MFNFGLGLLYFLFYGTRQLQREKITMVITMISNKMSLSNNTLGNFRVLCNICTNKKKTGFRFIIV